MTCTLVMEKKFINIGRKCKMKARIRFTRLSSLDSKNALITITDMKKHKVEVVVPMVSLMHAIMGVAGIDCDMEIMDISRRDK